MQKNQEASIVQGSEQEQLIKDQIRDISQHFKGKDPDKLIQQTLQGKQLHLSAIQQMLADTDAAIQELEKEKQLKQLTIEVLHRETDGLQQQLDRLLREQADHLLHYLPDLKKQQLDQLIQDNKALAHQLSSLKLENDSLANHNKRMEAILLDLQLLKKDKDIEHKKLSCENYEHAIKNKKLKSSRDNYLRE